MDRTLAMVLVFVWLAIVAFFWYYKVWLLFYLVGSVGCALSVIFVGQTLVPLEPFLEGIVGFETHQLCSLFGIDTRIFQEAPGLLLVLVVRQNPGWTSVQITIECSGLLESGVMIGMLGFYPGWSIPYKLWLGLIGLVLTHIANIARLMFIILTLSIFGKDSLFLAHTVVGRIVFFIAVVVIYWYVLTIPTLKSVRAKLQADMAR